MEPTVILGAEEEKPRGHFGASAPAGVLAVALGVEEEKPIGHLGASD